MIALNISGANAPKGTTAAHSAEECAAELANTGFAEVIDADDRDRMQDAAPDMLTPPSTSRQILLAGINGFLPDEADIDVLDSRTPTEEPHIVATFDMDVRKISYATQAHEPAVVITPKHDSATEVAKLDVAAETEISPIELDETRGRLAREGRSESVTDHSAELIGIVELAPNPRAQDPFMRVDSAPRGCQAELPEAEAPPQANQASNVEGGTQSSALSEVFLLDRDAETKSMAAVQPLGTAEIDPPAAVLNLAIAGSKTQDSDDQDVTPLSAEKSLAADFELDGSTTPTARSSAGPNLSGLPFAMAPMTLMTGKDAAEANAEGATDPEIHPSDSGVPHKPELKAQMGLVRPDQTLKPEAAAASDLGPINSDRSASPQREKRTLAREVTFAPEFANRSGPSHHGFESFDVQVQDSGQFKPILSRTVDAHQSSRSENAAIAGQDQVLRDIDKPTLKFVGGSELITASLAPLDNGEMALRQPAVPRLPANSSIASYRLSWHLAGKETQNHLAPNDALAQRGYEDDIAGVPSGQTVSAELPDLSERVSLEAGTATTSEVAGYRKGPLALSPTRPASASPTTEKSDLLAPPLGRVSLPELPLPTFRVSGRNTGQSSSAQGSPSESQENSVTMKLPYSPFGARGPKYAVPSVATDAAFGKVGGAAADPATSRVVHHQVEETNRGIPVLSGVVDQDTARVSAFLGAEAAAEWRKLPSVKPVANAAMADPTEDSVIVPPANSQKPSSSFPPLSPELPYAGTGLLHNEPLRTGSTAVGPSRPGTVPQSADEAVLFRPAVAGLGLRDRSARLKAGDQLSQVRDRVSGGATKPDQTARPAPLPSGPNSVDAVTASTLVANTQPHESPRVQPRDVHEILAPNGTRMRRPYSDRQGGQDESPVRTQGANGSRPDGVPAIEARAAGDLTGPRHAAASVSGDHADGPPAEYVPAIFQTNAAPRSGRADPPERTKARPGVAEVVPAALASPSALPARARPDTHSEKAGTVGAQAVSARKTVLATKPMPEFAMPNLVPGKPEFEQAVPAASDPIATAGPHRTHGLPGHLPATLAKAASAASADDRVELLLDPVELGKVRFELTYTAERVQVNVSVERPETLDLLRRNIDLLRAEFRDAGFDASTLSFSQWGRGANSAPQSPFAETALSNDLSAEEPASLTPQPARNASRQGLDLRL